MYKPTASLVAVFNVVLGVFFFANCASISEPWTTASQTSEAKPSKTDVPEVVVSSEPFEYSEEEFVNFTNKVKGLLNKRDFAGLDAMATELRKSKERFKKGGGWKIHSFYLLTGSPLSDTSEAGWELHLRFLNEWKEAMPGSVAARSSLASAHTGFAWLARGDEFADKVPESAWPIVEERLARAGMEIEEAAKLEELCYGYFEAALALGTTQGWDRERYDSIFQAAIRYDPSYQYFYTQKASYLMPRWSGEPGEWEAYAESVKNSLGEPDGLKLYYLIAAEIHAYRHEDNFFRENSVSWEDTKKGFVLFEKEFGITRAKINEFARMAFNAKDTQASCKTFKRLSGKDAYDPGSWKDREGFEETKRLAMMMCLMPKANNQAR